ncbi:MAG: FixH family protein [Xanthomonadales bacterium]|nr:FixH family protein [Xanthomonadales bacterium]
MNHPHHSQFTPEPWYRQFWPWVLIAIPAAAVIGSMIVLWLAVSRPDPLVVEPGQYQQIRDELRAQDAPESSGEGDG